MKVSLIANQQDPLNLIPCVELQYYMDPFTAETENVVKLNQQQSALLLTLLQLINDITSSPAAKTGETANGCTVKQ